MLHSQQSIASLKKKGGLLFYSTDKQLKYSGLYFLSEIHIFGGKTFLDWKYRILAAKRDSRFNILL